MKFFENWVARKHLAKALNKIFWKIPARDGMDNRTFAEYIRAELSDAGIEIAWDDDREEFV